MPSPWPSAWFSESQRAPHTVADWQAEVLWVASAEPPNEVYPPTAKPTASCWEGALQPPPYPTRCWTHFWGLLIDFGPITQVGIGDDSWGGKRLAVSTTCHMLLQEEMGSGIKKEWEGKETAVNYLSIQLSRKRLQWKEYNPHGPIFLENTSSC